MRAELFDQPGNYLVKLGFQSMPLMIEREFQFDRNRQQSPRSPFARFTHVGPPLTCEFRPPRLKYLSVPTGPQIVPIGLGHANPKFRHGLPGTVCSDGNPRRRFGPVAEATGLHQRKLWDAFMRPERSLLCVYSEADEPANQVTFLPLR